MLSAAHCSHNTTVREYSNSEVSEFDAEPDGRTMHHVRLMDVEEVLNVFGACSKGIPVHEVRDEGWALLALKR